MVVYAPEESFGVPRVGGMGNSTFVWRRGTGYGWLVGHVAFPPLAGWTESTICERWSGLSSSGICFPVFGSIIGCPCSSLATARQSGNMTRTTNLPLSDRDGGFVENVPVFMHLHWTFLPCTVTIFSPAGWGLTGTLGDLPPNR